MAPGLIFASGSDYLFLLAVLAATAFLLNRTRRRMARRQPDRPVLANAKPFSPPPADFAAMEVRMHEMARELTARIDSKMVVLQHLIREAEQQAMRLEALLERDDDQSRSFQDGERYFSPTSRATR